jgi:hypothetical protein
MVPEREIGPLERSIRDEHPDGGPLVELAARLALILDAGDGSAALAKELRAILTELRQRKPSRDPKAVRMERKRQSKWVMMTEGKWEWDDDADDWVRVDQEGD